MALVAGKNSSNPNDLEAAYVTNHALHQIQSTADGNVVVNSAVGVVSTVKLQAPASSTAPSGSEQVYTNGTGFMAASILVPAFGTAPLIVAGVSELYNDLDLGYRLQRIAEDWSGGGNRGTPYNNIVILTPSNPKGDFVWDGTNRFKTLIAVAADTSAYDYFASIVE